MARRRRVRGRGSVERLPSGAYRARIRGRRPDGRPFNLTSKPLPSREEAERALVGLRKKAFDVESGVVVLEETLTLAEWAPKARRRGLSWRRADASLWKNLRPLWNLPLVAIDAGLVRGWAARMEKAGYAPATIKSGWVLLSRLVQSAIAARVIARLPWGEAPLRLVADSECGQREGLEPVAWERVRDAARALDREGGGGALADLWLRLCVMRATGSRPVELCQVNPADVHAGQHGALLNIHAGIVAKGGRPGGRTLGAELALALAAHVERMPPRARSSGLLFPRRAQRGRWAPRFIVDPRGYKSGKWWLMPSELAALRARSGVDFDPYQLRHTRLTEAALHNPQLAQELGGHRNARTTQRYVHTSERDLRPELFDDVSAALGATGTDPLDPSDPSGGGGKRRGRFAVVEGGGEPSASASSSRSGGPVLRAHGDGSSITRAHDDTSSRGPGVGADPDDAAAVERYVAAIRAHGVNAVAAHVVASTGPLDALAEARTLAFVALQPWVDAASVPSLVSMVAALRAHADMGDAMAKTKTTPRIDQKVNGSGRIG